MDWCVWSVLLMSSMSPIGRLETLRAALKPRSAFTPLLTPGSGCKNGNSHHDDALEKAHGRRRASPLPNLAYAGEPAQMGRHCIHGT